jgi:hypothetical protein
MQQDFNLVSLDVYEPELFVSRTAEGTWNFQQLLAEEQPSAETIGESEQPAALPLLKIAAMALYDGKVHFLDQSPPGGISEELHGINLRLQNLSTHFDEKTGLDFWFTTGRQLTTEMKGNFGTNPPTAAVDFVVNGVQLEPYYPYLAEFLTAPVSGQLNLAGTFNLFDSGNIQLQHAQIALHELAVPFSGEDGFKLTDLSITGGSFDLQQQKASVATVKLSQGDLRASRFADGSLSPLKLLREREARPPVETTETDSKASTFSVALEQIELDDFDLLFTDNSLARTPQLQVDDLNINLANFTYPDSQQSPFKITARMGKKGSLDFSGNVAHSPLRVQAQTQLKALSLTEINDFLPEDVKVSLKDGKLYSNMAVKLRKQPETLTGSFNGQLAVSDFNLRDPLGDGELLGWESLNLAGIKGEIAPFKLDIKEVSLSNYQAKIQINPEGRVNLASVTATEEAAAADAPEKAADPEPVEVVVEEEPADAAPPPDIRIDALTLQGGTVAFTDRSLPNTFSATMYELGGRVTGMASDEEMLADVDLRGELENHSPLTITGKLNPLSKDLYADLTIKFKDIDLAPMSPYSGTYLGYIIDKGKLYLDLSYHIEHQKISAKNKIMIDQFTFGDSVKSDKATSLPVSLAVALLKDSNDEIHLDVPISGDLSDPSFSIGGAILTILKNILVKAATAPFSLLAAMLGGGDEDFTNLTFSSGVARIEESQQQTLGKLAGMLAKRPSLTLEISGYADADQDPEAYRQDQLRQRMLAAKLQDLKETGQASASLDALTISPEEYPGYLLKVYRAADFPRPRNFVGMLKKLPDAEMEKLLLANIRAGEEEMQTLAKDRALAVRDLLIAADETIKPQIFLKSVDIYQAPEKGAASRVEFNISSK